MTKTAENADLSANAAPAPRPVRGPHTPDERPSGPVRTWVMRVLVVVAASSSLVWIGAIAYGTFGDYKLTGFLDDRRFPEAAEPICEQAMKDVLAFPAAFEAQSPDERAGVIRQTTAVLATMQDDLRRVVPDIADAKYINEWIDDWSIHIDDRLDFAERLETKGADEEFFETTKADTQISKSLNHFAEVNQMESCQTPGDV